MEMFYFKNDEVLIFQLCVIAAWWEGMLFSHPWLKMAEPCI